MRIFFKRCQLQLLDWHLHLDKSLPGPLGVIGAWLHRGEMALREDFPIQQAPEEAANVLHRKLEQHKVTQHMNRRVLIFTVCFCNSEHKIQDILTTGMCDYTLQEVLRNLESHRQTFQQIHKDRSVNGVPVPSEQLQDMAERQDLVL